jgi:anti-sigma B factor antagonist
MAAKMHIKLINRGEEGELLLEGRLDSSTAPEVEEIALQVADRFDTVILNMAQLEYISSAGLRILKLLYMALRKKEGELQLKNVNKLVMEVFEMTGFAGLLTFI